MGWQWLVLWLGCVGLVWSCTPQLRIGSLLDVAPASGARAVPVLPQRPMMLVALAGGIGAGWALFGGWLGIGSGVLAGIGAVLVLRGVDPRANERVELARGFPLAVELLAGQLEAGAPLLQSVRSVAELSRGPTAALLGRVSAAMDVGCTEAEAWAQLGLEPVWGELARELSRCAHSGTACVGVLRSAGARFLTQEQARMLTQTRAISVRSVLPLVCCYLPAFLLVGVVPIIGGLLGVYLS